MLTAIGRAATQRLFLRAAPFAGLRAQPVVRAACRDFSTSQRAHVAAAKASRATTKTKKSTGAKDGAATKKKATATGTAKTKAKTKEGAATKLKKEKKKSGPKKQVKVLTPEEKQKLDVRKWKKLALLPEPKRLPTTKWLVYVTETTKGAAESEVRLVSQLKDIGESFKNLSSYELQRLQETADKNKLANNATYKAWVESHTPQAVAEANRARLQLRKAKGRLVPAHIRDDRLPTLPATSYGLFTKARWASGDFAGMKVSEATARIVEEWRGLSESEKNTYRDLHKANRDRYARDALSVLGRVVRPRKNSE
ncbi:HMG box protein [Colletotrichum falcatum]|nr:HMG box protein [Colletotrichum falcatum]